MKKHVWVLLSVLTAASLVFSACGGSKAASSKVKDSLVVINPAQPWSLDPALARDTNSVIIMRQVYETLFNIDLDTAAILPSLAERWAFENDANGMPTRLRLHLKSGVKFHNGEDFTASDIKFTLDRAATSPHLQNMVEAIYRTEIVNDHEVLVVLKFPFAPLLNNLAQPLMSITNERAVIEGGDQYTQNPVGTGPMKFVSWVAGNRIELTRNDDYHGAAPRIKDITVRFLPDPATALLELETGGADILIGVQPEDIARIEADSNLQLLRAMDYLIGYVTFNIQKPPFNDVRVRRAINHAIDREALVRTVYRDVGDVGKGPLASRVWASASGTLPQYEYDVEKARQLLAEAGYPNGFNTTFFTSEHAPRRDVSIIMKNMLSRVGINVDVQVLEWANLLETTSKGNHEMVIFSWVTITGDPDYGLEIFHTRAFGAPGNRSFYSNPEVDRLLDAGRMEMDTARREQFYLDAQKIIHDEAPWIYVQEGEVLIGVRSNVRGFRLDPSSYHSFFPAWFE